MIDEGQVTCLLPAFDSRGLSKGILESVRAFAVVWSFFFSLLCSKMYSGICASLCSLFFCLLVFPQVTSITAVKNRYQSGMAGKEGREQGTL